MAVRSTRLSTAARSPISSRAAGRSSAISPLSLVASSRICAIALSTPLRVSSSEPARSAEPSITPSPASPCKVSSCSSRAHRLRSCSEASIDSRSRSSATDLAVATAAAALTPKPAIRRSSSAVNSGPPERRSKAASTPWVVPRKTSGTSSALVAPAITTGGALEPRLHVADPLGATRQHDARRSATPRSGRAHPRRMGRCLRRSP